MKVLMVGVHKSTKGGMWTVVDNYLSNQNFCKKYNIKYIASAVSGNPIKRLLYSVWGINKVFFYTIFHKYDILHVHMSERMSVFRKRVIIKISKMRNSKVIIHMHGAEFETWYKTLNEKKQKKVRKTLNYASVILILGEYWREFITSLVDDKDKVKVLYNAVKCPKTNMYNYKANKLLFLGAIGKRKGIFDLIEAMKKVKKEKINTKLFLYGPDVTDGIEKIIQENKLEDYIEYKGWLKNEDKEKLFINEIAINILPSYNEGLPMTILETMSYGIPNITTNIAAIPEVVNNDNGYIDNPGDYNKISQNIKDFLNDKNIRKKLSENSYKTICNKFSIEKHIENLSKIYEEVQK